MRQKITFLLIVVVMVVTGISFAVETIDQDVTSSFARATVLDVKNIKPTGENVQYDIMQLVKLQVTSGVLKGQEINTENIISGSYVFDIPVKVGDQVIVQVDQFNTGETEVFITDFQRDGYLGILVALFVLCLLVIGRLKGLKTVITIGLTVLLIIKFMLPAVLEGRDPVPVTVISAILITVTTILFVSGFKKKSFAAIFGSISGVLIAALLAFFVGSQIRLTGMSSEEAIMLMNIPQGIQFNFRSLLFSGILLGALGAVMDVAMSIASSIEEVHKANPKLGAMELFRSGMEVGKDVMGTMSNTLILAYTGSSIPLILLFMAYETPMIRLLNMDLIATEVIRSLAGSVGLILTIPLTAMMTVLFISNELDSKKAAPLEEEQVDTSENISESSAS